VTLNEYYLTASKEWTSKWSMELTSSEYLSDGIGG